MIRTEVMTWSRKEIVVNAGTEIEKISDRITAKHSCTDGYGAIFEGICISCPSENLDSVFVSDYTEAKQDNTEDHTDFIELKPWGTIVLPRNREIQALNQPLLMGVAGDVVSIIAR